jgi:hypothetical protein
MGITLLASQGAQATTLEQGDQVYTTLADWQAAVTQLGVDTFEGVVGPGAAKEYDTSTGHPTGYTDGLGIDFVGSFNSTNFLEIVDAAFGTYYSFGSGASLASAQGQYNEPPAIIVTLPGNITAIALNVMTRGNSDSVTLTFSDGTSETVSTTGWPNQTFAGFTFSAPVTTLTISIPATPNYTTLLLDNFRIGTAGVSDPGVPEPATMLLLGLGLVFMACLRKRRPA